MLLARSKSAPAVDSIIVGRGRERQGIKLIGLVVQTNFSGCPQNGLVVHISGHIQKVACLVSLNTRIQTK